VATPESRIEVTQEIIDGAKGRDSSHCMVADAIKEQLPGAKRILVDIQTIRFSRKGRRFVFLTPRRAQQAIVWFDQADPRLEPFAFSLGKPVQTHEARDRKERSDGQRRLALDGDHMPTIRGGTTPPVAALAAGPSRRADRTPSAASVESGRFRQYGLRGLRS